MGISADQCEANPKEAAHYIASLTAEIERLRAALKEIQAYSVGDPRPRHTWYYDRAEAALVNQQIERTETK